MSKAKRAQTAEAKQSIRNDSAKTLYSLPNNRAARRLAAKAQKSVKKS